MSASNLDGSEPSVYWSVCSGLMFAYSAVAYDDKKDGFDVGSVGDVVSTIKFSYNL